MCVFPFILVTVWAHLQINILYLYSNLLMSSYVEGRSSCDPFVFCSRLYSCMYWNWNSNTSPMFNSSRYGSRWITESIIVCIALGDTPIRLLMLNSLLWGGLEDIGTLVIKLTVIWPIKFSKASNTLHNHPQSTTFLLWSDQIFASLVPIWSDGLLGESPSFRVWINSSCATIAHLSPNEKSWGILVWYLVSLCSGIQYRDNRYNWESYAYSLSVQYTLEWFSLC